MKKTICSLVAGLILSGSALAGDIPEGFKGYKKAENIERHIIIKAGKPLLKVDYTFDKNYIDVSELYPITRLSNGKVITTFFPLFYGFNSNKDNKITPDEIYIDKKMDGWNGNERLLVGVEI